MVKIQIIGHLGRDCDQKEINGRTVINFNVASSEKFKDSAGNMQNRTTWVRCTYWTSSPGIAEYLKKGKLVYAEGTPSVQAFKKNDGEPGASLEMRVRRVELLGGRDPEGFPGGDSGTSQVVSVPTPEGKTTPSDYDASEDDLPF